MIAVGQGFDVHQLVEGEALYYWGSYDSLRKRIAWAFRCRCAAACS